MPTSKLLMLSLFFVCAAVGVLGGCKNEETPKTLRVALSSEPVSLDPQQADTGVSIFVLRQVYSTLLRLDAEQKIRSYDAQSWTWEKQGRQLRLRLRKDLTWSDGAALEICQYRDALLRALDPKNPSRLADLLFDIEGARERVAGAPESQVGIRCNPTLGELLIQTRLTYSPQILFALSFIVSAPYRPEALKKNLSTGAYKITGWVHDRRIKLQARQLNEKNLPADRLAQVLYVNMPIVKESSTALSLYEKGELDYLDELPPARMAQLSLRGDFRSAPAFTTYMVGFSFKDQPAVRNIHFRRALAFAASQSSIPKVLGGGEEAADSWIPPALLPQDFRTRATLENLLEAKKEWELFKKSFPQWQKLNIRLSFNSGERHQLLMERLAYVLQKELGLNLELEAMEWKVHVARVKQSAPDLWRYAWAAAYPDPLFFLELFHSTSQNNFGAWKNEGFDRLVDELRSVPLAKRDEKFFTRVQRAQNILLIEDPALIPLYHYVRQALVSPKLEGFYFSFLGGPLLKDLNKRP